VATVRRKKYETRDLPDFQDATKPQAEHVAAVAHIPSSELVAVVLSRCLAFESFYRPLSRRRGDAPPYVDANVVANLHLGMGIVALRELDWFCQQLGAKNCHLG
jgi:hypothetical protein